MLIQSNSTYLTMSYYEIRKRDNAMKTRKRGTIRGIVLALTLIFMMFPAGAFAWPGPYGSTESYFNYQGNYPNNGYTAYSYRSQGLAHDEDHWFITQKHRIWKIPVVQDLNTVTSESPGVLTLHINDAIIQGLASEYDHFGDPDCYKYDGTWYLIVPVEDKSKTNPAIAIFHASDLALVGYEWLEQPLSLPNIDETGWAAVDNQGHIYSSDPTDSYYTEYQLDWAELKSSDEVPTISRVTSYPFLDEEGNEISWSDYNQGGEFSDSGRLLYISNGSYSAVRDENDGINVFDTLTHRRVAHSTMPYAKIPNTTYERFMLLKHFIYEWTYDEEPEGLTIWDLDGRDAPNIEGQLHVLLNNWNAGEDQIWIKHYTHTISVDRNHSGHEFIDKGTPSNPFSTIGEAINYAWNGAKIMVKAGSYPENLTISKQVKIVQDGGSVTIGE